MRCVRYGMARSSSQRESGFTLLELCTVLAIVVITTAIALPLVSSALTNSKVQSATTSISGAIQVARYKALSKGVPYQITFDSTAGTYTVLACSSCATTIYSPSSTFTYGADPSDPLTNVPIPFSSGPSGALLDSNYAFYFMPGGAVQWCGNGTSTCTSPATNCSSPITMTVSYRDVSTTMTVECYGKITVAQ